MPNTERYSLTWKGQHPTLEEVIQSLPPDPPGDSWKDILQENEGVEDWDGLEDALKQVSLRFPGVLFAMKIHDIDDNERWVQYHRDGRHYEEPEVRFLPEFDPARLNQEGETR